MRELVRHGLVLPRDNIKPPEVGQSGERVVGGGDDEGAATAAVDIVSVRPQGLLGRIRAGQQYSTIHPNSQNSVGTSGCGCLWYGAYITKQNLVAAVNRINSRYPAAGMSTDTNNYLLTFVGAGTEMYAPSGTSGWIGSRIWEVMALTEY